jgi:hypothetical protein
LGWYEAVDHEGDLLVVEPGDVLHVFDEGEINFSEELLKVLLLILMADCPEVQERVELDDVGLVVGPELDDLLQELNIIFLGIRDVRAITLFKNIIFKLRTVFWRM